MQFRKLHDENTLISVNIIINKFVENQSKSHTAALPEQIMTMIMIIYVLIKMITITS